MVRGAVSALVEQTAKRDVTAVVRATGVGHAVPTGDPFRRLTLRRCADEACTIVLRSALFARGESGVDTRLPPNAGAGSVARRVFHIEPAVPSTLWWELRLFYGDPTLEDRLGAQDISLWIDGGQVGS